MNARPLVALVVKDLRVFVADRYALTLSFIAPIALASFMALIFGGAGSSTPSKISIRLTDEDDSPISRRIVLGAQDEPTLDAIEQPLDASRDAVRKGDAVLSVVIPEGFGASSADALYGDAEPPALIFLHDPMSQSEISLARGLLTRVILEAVTAEAMPDGGNDELLDLLTDEAIESSIPESDEAIQRAEFLALFPGQDEWWQSPDPEAEAARLEVLDAFPALAEWFEADPIAEPVSEPIAFEPVVEDRQGLTLPFKTEETSIAPRGAAGEQAALAAHAFAGMVVQFVLFSAVEWGVVLLQERRRGMWKRLRAAPISRSTLMLSKVLSCAIVSLIITLVVFTAGALLFGYRLEGDWHGFLGLAVAFALMASAFGLTVATLGRSPQGARSVALLGVLVMVMLGGCWIPSFLFPEWIQTFTPAIPTRWAIDGFDGVFTRGFSFAETVPMISALSFFGLGFTGWALLAFRWNEP
ncbi:ABC transporter permease [Tautonia marina]|uniref:ABC transporter permease n=1 Tax=Tautonia marina TaxID=2653855 RepID=UPI0012612F6F|nr:ABC transporter permease [Tautonia marina]